ncbi:lipolytic protein G-D-S-L family [Leptolyngbya sp. 'hensonii']|uniref:SGNH/GDSL hydrolase family protein n=1 Tax=Leptolyngbya sp. 'hensonii' TaxID=1922337 RepID=UPI00094FD47A|nr:SGNH/GDSL hydrolase family protein [Leptolyngbya sp. 'hensonii']OLP17997.1 lipolytic protein G-D-S-L family [Leptolyngbya sp. 'hensonii']
MKIVLIAIALLLIATVLVEAGLRLLFGFGNPLIYIADPQIGYLLAPNQRVRRFGNRIEINAYSMRSPPVSLQKAAGTMRVMLLGDSVANGGWWTDQADTISELLRQMLQEGQSSAKQDGPIEVLNASANSWGPRNQLAYVERFGSFASQMVVLIINTDDLFATVPSSLAVGRDVNYPDRKPRLAMEEFLGRYVFRPKPDPALTSLQEEAGDRVGSNLMAIQTLKQRVNQAGGQLLLVMTPLLREVEAPGPRDYELKARQRLLDFTQAENLPYLDMLTVFKLEQNPAGLYRDHIHLSPEGNRVVSNGICTAIYPRLP